MSRVEEQIAELECQIETLRYRAVLELTEKLAEARKQVASIERQISELEGAPTPAKTTKQAKVPIGVTTEDHPVCQKQQDVVPKLLQPIQLPHRKENEARNRQHSEASESHDPGKVLREVLIPRKLFEAINIGDDVELRVTRIDDWMVRVSIEAPKEIGIFRGELYRDIQRQKKANAAAGTTP